MALFQCRFFSEVLGLSTSMTVILPEPAESQIGMSAKGVAGPYPTLYLLHGMSDDDSIWLRRTSIERYVSGMGLAVVMPQVDLSFYTDMAEGNRYWTFVSEELPRLCRSFFPLSARREDTFVAGLSMGGYGAFKLALRKPEMFAAAASLSGALDINARFRLNDANFALLRRIFGDAGPQNSENDLLALLEQTGKGGKPVPRLYQCCGTEDFLYTDNRTFNEACVRLEIPLTYEEGPGEHEWGYWDAKIQDVLKWLPLQAKTE
ncbi:alpha/beta hydrolase family protein [Paenibacillus macerans]|uniref:alpha/beta hydrolase n=1 Tax=Paenibacillus macerans TaxID=44252 RepID=UPI00203EFBDB|nr:alpha/beta hydrolase family protein [Paenibacillus macerans]MCM3699028.1 esterase family protein [Paenibacillus macerans]